MPLASRSQGGFLPPLHFHNALTSVATQRKTIGITGTGDRFPESVAHISRTFGRHGLLHALVLTFCWCAKFAALTRCRSPSPATTSPPIPSSVLAVRRAVRVT